MGYLLGVIGYPAKHSLSPWIHEKFLAMSELDGVYRAYEIEEDFLSSFLRSLKAMNVDGFNVTVPYKEKIIPFLDKVDDSVKYVGAVNTVVNQNGQWIGYNTDGIGYIKSLQHEYPSFFETIDNKKILIIGAGGAARGIYYALASYGFTYIDIANRTVSRAHTLIENKTDKVVTSLFTLEQGEELANQYDLIIQTTNMGMTPNVNSRPISLNKLKDAVIISDIVYNPMETKFLSSGRKLEAHIHYGHGMLLFQAAYAFQLWTGLHINPSNMLQELMEKLQER
ncbi:shikimate dehydrogenase [Salirhabdus sp. Marseille-P4669]|uniref:shikimate dehydrogenase n=1 Tax=Salirhabdus sp. Marseille-P4669 TaxID=2042310 RepID=UPI000C7DEB0E|nr:shikimate dehydrogenase [Salirhabdus sp. Marseille-P4669]